MAISLRDLLDEDPYAEQYYLSLPEMIRKSAAEHSEELRTREDLHRYAVEALQKSSTIF